MYVVKYQTYGFLEATGGGVLTSMPILCHRELCIPNNSWPHYTTCVLGTRTIWIWNPLPDILAPERSVMWPRVGILCTNPIYQRCQLKDAQLQDYKEEHLVKIQRIVERLFERHFWKIFISSSGHLDFNNIIAMKQVARLQNKFHSRLQVTVWNKSNNLM